MRRQETSAVTFLLGLTLGAVGMLILDPARGPRRRALLRDKSRSILHRGIERVSRTERDLLNRARGMAAEVRGRMREKDVDDEILIQRVRSQLGRVCSHPRSVKVDADEGRVMLSGNALQEEVDAICSIAGSVRGVRQVYNRLIGHEFSGRIPELQG